MNARKIAGRLFISINNSFNNFERWDYSGHVMFSLMILLTAAFSLLSKPHGASTNYTYSVGEVKSIERADSSAFEIAKTKVTTSGGVFIIRGRVFTVGKPNARIVYDHPHYRLCVDGNDCKIIYD